MSHVVIFVTFVDFWNNIILQNLYHRSVTVSSLKLTKLSQGKKEVDRSPFHYVITNIVFGGRLYRMRIFIQDCG